MNLTWNVLKICLEKKNCVDKLKRICTKIIAIEGWIAAAKKKSSCTQSMAHSMQRERQHCLSCCLCANLSIFFMIWHVLSAFDFSLICAIYTQEKMQSIFLIKSPAKWCMRHQRSKLMQYSSHRHLSVRAVLTNVECSQMMSIIILFSWRGIVD